MSIAVIRKSSINGEFTAPPSKSEAHRAIICASLTKGICTIKNITLCDDVFATINAFNSLGAKTKIQGNDITIDATKMFECGSEVNINCSESASSFRFIIPIVAAKGIKTHFSGKGMLPFRPIDAYDKCFENSGVKLIHGDNSLPLTVSGKINKNKFIICSDISSQFITGILIAVTLLKEDSDIILPEKVVSCGYVNMTINILNHFGIEITKIKEDYKIKGGQKFMPANYTVSGDWSNASFFMAGALISENSDKLIIKGLDSNTQQGDKEMFNILKSMGANIFFDDNKLVVYKSKLSAIDLDVTNIPDLFPVVSVMLACCEGSSRIKGVNRLKFKESDRLMAVADMLKSLGADVNVKNDCFIINPVKQFKGCSINSQKDHRITMAAAIAGLNSLGNIEISNAESINKSYPEFFNVYNYLGGKADVINVG